MKTTPYMIRLGQLAKDLPDYADAIRAAHQDGHTAPAEEARVELAQTVALALHKDAVTHAELNDPVLGVALTQKSLQGLIDQGFQTIYSTEAFALHALDVRTDQGHIAETDRPRYVAGELDPTSHIEQLIVEFDFTSFEISSGQRFYICPHF